MRRVAHTLAVLRRGYATAAGSGSSGSGSSKAAPKATPATGKSTAANKTSTATATATTTAARKAAKTPAAPNKTAAKTGTEAAAAPNAAAPAAAAAAGEAGAGASGAAADVGGSSAGSSAGKWFLGTLVLAGGAAGVGYAVWGQDPSSRPAWLASALDQLPASGASAPASSPADKVVVVDSATEEERAREQAAAAAAAAAEAAAVAEEEAVKAAMAKAEAEEVPVESEESAAAFAAELATIDAQMTDLARRLTSLDTEQVSKSRSALDQARQHRTTAMASVLDTLASLRAASSAAAPQDQASVAQLHARTSELAKAIAELAVAQRSVESAAAAAGANDASVRSAGLLSEMERLYMAAESVRLREQLVQQEHLFQEEVQRIRDEAERNAAAQVQRTMKAQRDQLVKALEEQHVAAERARKLENERILDAEVAKLRRQHEAAQRDRIAQLEALRLRLESMQKVLDTRSDYERVSHDVHRVNVAMHALASVLEEKRPFTEEWAALRRAATGDDVLTHILDSVPNGVAADGLDTVQQLSQRFQTVSHAARSVASVPPEGGMWNYAYSATVNTLKHQPSHELVPVRDDEPATLLSRAEYHLDHGDVASAVEEVAKLQGECAHVAQHWLEAARNRLVVEQAMRAVRAQTTVLTASFA